jgi:hypothetical protein
MAVNRWTALKQTKGIEAIRKEVDEWDTSALSDTFALTKLALLDEVPNAMKALDHLLATERLTIDEADSWPVLASLRSDDAFAELTAAYRD